MKRIFTAIISAALMLAALDASAQFRVEGGYLHPTLTSTQGAVSRSFSGNGFYGGIGADLWLPVHGLSMDFGAYWDYTVYKDFLGFAGSKVEIQYVRIPLRFKYTYHFSDDFKIFAMAGPGVTYAVVGKMGYQEDGLSVKGDLYDDDDHRFDVQVGGEAGVKLFEHLSIKAGYDWGLMNQGDDDIPVKRNLLHAGVALEF